MNKLNWNNKSNKDLPNEEWVSACGFDGLYEVSNKGRVRSVDRLINAPNGQRMLKGRVLSQCKVNHKGDSDQFSLYVRLANGDGTYSNVTVGALVLNSFKRPDEYNDTTHHINGVSCDNRLKNLTFEDLSTKRKIEYDIELRDGAKNTKHWKESGHLKRRSKAFKNIARKESPTAGETFEKRNKNPVAVYIAKDKFIGSYTCIKNASEQLGIKEETLRNALHKPESYQYIQVKEGIFNISEFKPKPKKKHNKIIIGSKRYSFMKFSKKYKIPFTTLYYKFRELNVDDFKKWIVEKTSIKIDNISVEKET